MRNGTAFLLILLAVLVAVGGLQGLGWFLAIVIALALAIVLAVAFGFWVLRRRARRVLTAWERHMGDTFRTPPPGTPGPGLRGNVIDVEPSEVRDVTPPKPPERPGQGQ